MNWEQEGGISDVQKKTFKWVKNKVSVFAAQTSNERFFLALKANHEENESFRCPYSQSEFYYKRYVPFELRAGITRLYKQGEYYAKKAYKVLDKWTTPASLDKGGKGKSSSRSKSKRERNFRDRD